MAAKSSHLPELDGLRFFAFALVYFHHIPGYLSPNDLIARLQDWGRLGVDLFFVLSAFVITRLLLAEFERTGSIDIRKFLIRRALRIWPLYYFFIFLGVALFPFFLEPRFGTGEYQDMLSNHLPSLLLFYSNFVMSVRGWTPNIGDLWSISVEEHFYLLWPLVLLTALKLGKRKWFLPVATAGIGLVVSARSLALSNSHSYMRIYPITYLRADSFLVGALCALFHKRLMRVNQAALGAAALFFIAAAASQPSIIHNSPAIAWQFAAIALGFGAMILFAQKNRPFRDFLRFKPFTYLGKISFGLYIFHELAISLTEMMHGHLAFSGMAFVATSAAIAIILASVSYRYLELPFLKFKERFAVL